MPHAFKSQLDGLKPDLLNWFFRLLTLHKVKATTDDDGDRAKKRGAA
jgi:hypothetical protein